MNFINSYIDKLNPLYDWLAQFGFPANLVIIVAAGISIGMIFPWIISIVINCILVYGFIRHYHGD